jgi:hypothetical protein
VMRTANVGPIGYLRARVRTRSSAFANACFSLAP